MADDILPKPSTGPVLDDNKDSTFENADYKPIPSNWFTAKPYGFRFTNKKGDAKVMYLPIGPNNLTITTNFATTITPTIYGTVEEHSPVRYFDIAIEGTTGMGPKYTVPMAVGEKPVPKGGRTAFAIKLDLSTAAGGLFSKTLGTVDKAISGVGNIVDIFAGKTTQTGLHLDQTGYMAFHNLYRFFLKYKKDVSGTDTKDGKVDTSPRDEKAKHPLVFFNYKDNNEYNVVIKSFTLRRDKENPMLYYYSIVLRGYALKGIDSSEGINDVTSNADMMIALGLNGIKGTPFMAKLQDAAAEAREILGSVANGVSQLGR